MASEIAEGFLAIPDAPDELFPGEGEQPGAESEDEFSSNENLEVFLEGTNAEE